MSAALLYIPHSRLVWMDCPTSPEVASMLAAELSDHHEDHYVRGFAAAAAPPRNPPNAR